jgi:uncharacterized protein (TIGR03000 family)
MITAIVVMAILKGGGDSLALGNGNQGAYQSYSADATRANTAASAAAPATIEVSLPADASVTIDDTITESTSASRKFVTPPLDPDTEYNYTIKVEITRDGRDIIASKQITVRAGEIVKVAVRITEDVAQR